MTHKTETKKLHSFLVEHKAGLNAALHDFVNGCQDLINAHYKDTPEIPRLSIDKGGVKFARIVKERLGARSVYCFVDLTNGDILKSASWKAPAPHARGNIYDEHKGLARMTVYGPEYLK